MALTVTARSSLFRLALLDVIGKRELRATDRCLLVEPVGGARQANATCLRWEVLTIFAMREARQRRATLVCYADKRTWNGVVFNLGEFALTAC